MATVEVLQDGQYWGMGLGLGGGGGGGGDKGDGEDDHEWISMRVSPRMREVMIKDEYKLQSFTKDEGDGDQR